MQIENDHWVTVRYRLFDSDGEPIEDAERELTYLQGGYGAVFPRVEQALAGREPGYQASLYLQPDDTFGDYDADLVRLAPRDDFPDSIEIGMTFEGLPGDEDASDDEDDRLFVVTDFTGDVVVLDGNHPLAGMALRFDVRVLAVRAATPAEVARERARAASEAGDGPGDEDDEEPDDRDGDGDEDDEGGLEAPGRSDDPDQFGRVRPDARRTLH
jgi:FKBP-type peptidyl-prolyl cis-trans isomerase SlyD